MKTAHSFRNFLLIAAVLVCLSAGCNIFQTSDTRPSANSTNSTNTSMPQNNSAPSAPITTHYDTKLTVGARQLLVEVANTNQTRQQGLSDRESMADGEGMLFDFTGSGRTNPGFWMKDMHFALDFIWIDGDKIVGITPSVQPGVDATGRLPLYYPPAPVTQVLEVNAGWSSAHGIKVGDAVSPE